MVVAAIVGIVFIIIGASRGLSKSYLMYAAAAYVIISFVGLQIVPGIVQSLVVSPNELRLERPYLEHNIEFTRKAYGLDDVQVEDFNVTMNLTRDIIEQSPETINNARILDLRPLTETYKQTQEIRLYYDLSSIDIDRYQFDGNYRQVLIAPREMNQDKIADKAKTWVNLHMIYTHGFGVVMSPVNEVTPEGLPKYLIQDIPPETKGIAKDLKIDQPRLYYSQEDNEYVLVDTEVQEFDYPKGDENAMTNYDGEGGVEIDSFFKRLMFAIRFSDVRMLTTSGITEDTNLMFNRQIKNRLQKLTPFINLDRDPYIVINDGRLSWIVDGYTTSSTYPYSEPLGRFNYIRNSVKMTVDAYEGNVNYYMPEEDDPLIQTYANIFPDVFQDISEMDDNLRQHIRYPIDLFEIQSEIYKDYHMTNPDVFYNREDAWELPTEIYGQGQRTDVEPYYNIMRLPGEDEEEFTLLNTFTPIRKDNMIAWFAGRSDGEDYGDLILFRFPKDKLIYGPLQIEAKIDQDSEISQQLTLWSQQGSRVTRGNLLVLPLGKSMLYVEPLYIQAETGQLPALKRILLSDGERVVMERTVGEALDALFGKKTTPDEGDTADGDGEPSDLAREAQRLYERLRESAREGNWTSYGESLDQLGDVIEQMGGNATG